jgi:hypothetical protein
MQEAKVDVYFSTVKSLNTFVACWTIFQMLLKLEPDRVVLFSA